MISTVQIKVNEKTYIKDPFSSELGIRIVEVGIEKLLELGFEDFTFRKLAVAIKSTEASIYRYFENKHKFVLFLISWYWNWRSFKLGMATLNITDPVEKLNRAMQLITEKVETDNQFSYINEVKLHEIVSSEFNKSYLHKNINKETNQGLYLEYKNFINLLSEIILENNPDYRFPKVLVSTVIESIIQQRYFLEHLQSLSNNIEENEGLEIFFKEIVFKAIGK